MTFSGDAPEWSLSSLQAKVKELELQIDALTKERDILKIWGERADVAAIEEMKVSSARATIISNMESAAAETFAKLEESNRLNSELAKALKDILEDHDERRETYPGAPEENPGRVAVMNRGRAVLNKTEKRAVSSPKTCACLHDVTQHVRTQDGQRNECLASDSLGRQICRCMVFMEQV